MAGNAESVVDEPAGCLSDVMIYGCPSGSFLQGIEWEENFRGRLQELAGVPVLYACRMALEAMGRKKMASPLLILSR